MPAPVVHLEGVTYAYPAWSGAEADAPVLDGVDLGLVPGLTLIAGDSGSGKTTLLRVLNGLVPHFHGGRFGGRATVGDRDVLTTPTRILARRVGFVFQEPELGFVRGTVEREVAFGPENLALPPMEVRRHVGRALERAGIATMAGRRLRSLSGGERQRVALAAALAVAQEVVALDEPTSQLDHAGAAALGEGLRALADDGHVVVVAEHRFDRLGAADRVVAVSGGRLEELAGLPGPVPPTPSWWNATERRPPRRAARSNSGPASGNGEAWALVGATIGVGGRALVTDLDLAGVPGEVLVVTGANGSGKTTLLRTIAGLAPALSGTLSRRPGRVAYLPQESGVLLHRSSVRAEVAQTLRWSEGGDADGPDAVLELLGLLPIADRDPRDLSSGQRQRAALAAVLAGSPSLALLDEPTRGMDAAARRSLRRALRAMAEAGTAVVLATHDEPLADELGDRVLHIDDGILRPLRPGPTPAGGRADGMALGAT